MINSIEITKEVKAEIRKLAKDNDITLRQALKLYCESIQELILDEVSLQADFKLDGTPRF